MNYSVPTLSLQDSHHFWTSKCSRNLFTWIPQLCQWKQRPLGLTWRFVSGAAGMIYKDSDNITCSVTRSASHLSSFVKQISLDVSSECNSDVHSQSRGWLRWKRHPFSRLQTGVSLSLTPRLIVSQSFLMVEGCSLSCDLLTFGKIGWWCPFLKKNWAQWK